MNDMIQLGGFSIRASSQRTILVIFILYMAVILGLGIAVKIMNSRKKGGGFSNFLTGGGNLSALETAMVAATSLMAGGVMISAPGMAYRDGFIYTLISFGYYLNNFTALGTYGKKNAIMKQRLNAKTTTQLFHHRYQSRATAIIVTLCAVSFLVILAGAQFKTAAKMFSAVLGSEAYAIGLMVSAVVVILFAVSGGVKLLSKVCVIQGFLMLLSVLLLAFSEFRHISLQYGTLQAAMELAARVKPELVYPHYSPLYFFSLILIASVCNPTYPAFVQTSMMYNKVKVLIKAVIISTALGLIIQLIMATSGPIAYLLNPGLTDPDHSTIYLTTNLLPSVLSGIVIAGVYASIQSASSSFLIFVAGALTQDLYKDCIRKDASDKALSKINTVLFLCAGLIAIITAMNPSDLTQMLIILACGGVATSYGVPCLFGTFWKRATAPGALASCLGGFTSYLLLYFLQSNAATNGWYARVLSDCHPLILALILSISLMILVSLATPNCKVPLGVYKVWFCREYDPRYAAVYDAQDLEALKKQVQA